MEKQPLGIIPRKDLKIEISPNEYFQLKRFLDVFQMPISIINNIENKLFMDDKLRTYTEDDMINIQRDENGNITSFDIREDFWEVKPESTIFDQKNMD